MRRTRGLLLLASATLSMALTAAGCAEDTFDVWSVGGASEASLPSYDFQPTGNMQARAGALYGAVGPVAGLDHDASRLSAWSDGYWSSIEVVVERENDGQLHTFDGSVWGQGLYISLLGCSGPEADYWTYDESADEVTVEVREDAAGSGVYTIQFSASFDTVAYDYQPIDGSNEPTTVTGTVTVAIER
jgi:hypothetical protein